MSGSLVVLRDHKEPGGVSDTSSAASTNQSHALPWCHVHGYADCGCFCECSPPPPDAAISTEPNYDAIWMKNVLAREVRIAEARAVYERAVADAEDEFATSLAKEATNAILVSVGRGDGVLP